MRFRCGKWTQRKKKYFQFKSSEKANRSSINIRPSLSCDFLNFLGKFKIILFLKDMTGSFFKKKFRKFQEIQEEKIEKILEKKKILRKKSHKGLRTANRTPHRTPGRKTELRDNTLLFQTRNFNFFDFSFFSRRLPHLGLPRSQTREGHSPPPTHFVTSFYFFGAQIFNFLISVFFGALILIGFTPNPKTTLHLPPLPF